MVMVVVDDSVDLFFFFLLLSTTEYTGISGVYGQDVQLHSYSNINAIGCVFTIYKCTLVVTLVHEY